MSYISERREYAKVLEVNSSFTLHRFLEVDKTQDLPSKFWQTLGDALMFIPLTNREGKWRAKKNLVLRKQPLGTRRGVTTMERSATSRSEILLLVRHHP
jgi:hypothetical protein